MIMMPYWAARSALFEDVSGSALHRDLAARFAAHPYRDLITGEYLPQGVNTGSITDTAGVVVSVIGELFPEYAVLGFELAMAFVWKLYALRVAFQRVADRKGSDPDVPFPGGLLRFSVGDGDAWYEVRSLPAPSGVPTMGVLSWRGYSLDDWATHEWAKRQNFSLTYLAMVEVWRRHSFTPDEWDLGPSSDTSKAVVTMNRLFDLGLITTQLRLTDA